MKDTILQDIIVRSYETLRPGDPITRAASLFRKTRFDGLPVIDSRGGLKGVMTKANLYDAVSSGTLPGRPIDGFYTRNPVTVQDHISYDDLSRIVRTSKVGTGIVLNDRNEVTGVFSKADWIKGMFKKEAMLSSRLKAIYDTMHNGLIAVDSRGRITDINNAARKILDMTSEQALGQAADTVLPGLDINRIIISRQPLIGVNYQHKSISLLCNITPVKGEKAGQGAIIVIQDTTDLARIISELANVTHQYETLDSIMEIAYDGIIVVDKSSRITMLNRSASRLLNKNTKDLIGRPAREVIDNTMLHIVIKTGLPEKNKVRMINGEPYVVTILPIKKQGKIIGAVCKILFRDVDEIKELVQKLDNLDQELAYYKDEVCHKTTASAEFDTILTNDPEFKRIKKEGQVASRGASNVLITGESGTGKELFAKAIHMAGLCSQGPLVRVNCAAIPDSLLEAEFFGYAPGAFTGASSKGRIGKLAAADSGTLFLDEIGDMSFSLQSKLLRVLQDQVFEPVGSDTSVKVNIRFIAATNQDLVKLVNEGRFRKDLYYRLNVIHLPLPPLRKRVNDIELLAGYFLEKYNRTFGASVSYISKDVLEIFNAHDWPGNVRELENVIERAINFAGTQFLEIGDLPMYLQEKTILSVKTQTTAPIHTLLKHNVGEHEINLIKQALESTGQNKAKAARLLGISRSWLYKKMARAGIQ
ncbi:MAG: PAS domain-containing protein [Deltaproteobacteria bacterium]|nr:PAS domain-containing protein [Deltaproteobacteria bacterium]